MKKYLIMYGVNTVNAEREYENKKAAIEEFNNHKKLIEDSCDSINTFELDENIYVFGTDRYDGTDYSITFVVLPA